MHVDCQKFLAVTRQPLAEGNADQLAWAVERHWSAGELCPLLGQADVDVRRVAAVVLGLIGDHSVTACLTAALKDEDAQVNQMAEHALWAIWFRSCSAEAVKPFQTGVDLLAEEAYEQAQAAFRQALSIDPHFAEAHHQCAIALFFLSRWEDSIDDNLAAIRSIPHHFGAMTGIGHCYAHLDQLDQAQHWYDKALKINPRMPTIRRALKRLREQSHKSARTRFPDRR